MSGSEKHRELPPGTFSLRSFLIANFAIAVVFAWSRVFGGLASGASLLWFAGYASVRWTDCKIATRIIAATAIPAAVCLVSAALYGVWVPGWGTIPALVGQSGFHRWPFRELLNIPLARCGWEADLSIRRSGWAAEFPVLVFWTGLLGLELVALGFKFIGRKRDASPGSAGRGEPRGRRAAKPCGPA